MTFETLSGLVGIFAFALSVLSVIVGSIYMGRSSATKTASDAQQGAIAAMQAEINTLRGRTDDLKKENTRLELLIETICSVLKMRGLLITVQGEMISIEDSKGSTTAKIHGSLHTMTDTTNP